MARIQGWPYFRGPGVHCIPRLVALSPGSLFFASREVRTARERKKKSLEFTVCACATFSKLHKIFLMCGANSSAKKDRLGTRLHD